MGATWRVLRIVRRSTQVASLVAFVALIAATTTATGASVSVDRLHRVEAPVAVFLEIDPLVAVTAMLAGGALAAGLLWSLLVAASAVFAGRWFCGWVCPLGTINHALSHPAKKTPAAVLRQRNAPTRTRRIKYLILVFGLVSALWASALIGWLDPICIATRGIALTLWPLVQFAWLTAAGALSRADTAWLQRTADAMVDALSVTDMNGGWISANGIAMALLFVAILAANRIRPKFWCRALCPLGALLGALGRRSLLVLHKDPDRCTQCHRCERHCVGAASPEPNTTWLRAECEWCLNCVAACPHDALRFTWARKAAADVADAPDVGKRRLVAAAAAGAVAVPLLRTHSAASVLGRPRPTRIRPPGAVGEDAFLSRCIRCGQCMKICPTNALHPAWLEAGPEGVWTPIMIPRIGYCEPTCTLCSQVCPTDALIPLEPDAKVGKDADPFVRVGTAFIDRGRCLPFANGIPCTVCEEFCPVSPKAIVLRPESVPGTDKTIKRPYVDPALCSGCGACEFACPVHDQAAIRVSSAGESRDTSNRLLL